MEQLENGRESVDTSHSIGDEGQSAADIERFDRWRDEWLRPDTIGTRRLDAGASTEPNLSIVARNEHPIRSWMSDSSSPDLRVIEVGGEAASIPAGDDLLDRLAGTWEQSFLPNADDAFATEHSLDFIPDFPANDHLRLIEGQNHIPARQADGGEDGMIRPLLDRLSEAAVEPLESSDARSRDASTGERSWAPGTPADDPAIRVSPAPIPLFGDFLPVDVESLPATNPEPAITARQAVMEVASELQHLARTGGSELSFSLRLHPEHLGHIEVEIQRTNDVWSISIVAAHEEARDVLAAEISRLEHRFRDQNLTLDAITVVTKPSESAIIAPFAGEQTASTEFQHSGQPGFAGERNQDKSG